MIRASISHEWRKLHRNRQHSPIHNVMGAEFSRITLQEMIKQPIPCNLQLRTDAQRRSSSFRSSNALDDPPGVALEVESPLV